MPKISEERRDNLVGGTAIILLGMLLCGSAIWGLADDIYSMNSGAAPPLFIILGVGTILIGVFVLYLKPQTPTADAPEAQIQ